MDDSVQHFLTTELAELDLPGEMCLVHPDDLPADQDEAALLAFLHAEANVPAAVIPAS